MLDALEAASAHHTLSLDTPREDGEGEVGTLGDAIGEIDDRFELIDAGDALARAASQLTEREREVLALRFIGDCSQTQIAERIGVSQMQVSRILRRTLSRMSELVDPEPAALDS